jgi:DNA-binding HxlR family transcriptional regulator
MPSTAACRIDPVLDVIGDLWTLDIIHQLSAGPRRPVELHSCFSGLSTRTMMFRLKKLVRQGVVARTSFREAPPRVEYSLTDKGAELFSVLLAIAEVAERWNPEAQTAANHSCRACSIMSEKTSSIRDRSAAKRQTEPDPNQAPRERRPRKRTDVTLL